MLDVGEVSFVPAVLAWLIGGIFLLTGSKDRDVRLGVTLTTAHLLWWVLVFAIGTSGNAPPGEMAHDTHDRGRARPLRNSHHNIGRALVLAASR